MRTEISESRIRASCSASRCEPISALYRTHYACLRIHQDRRAGQSGLPRRPRSAARSGRIARARARSSRRPRRLEAARGLLRSQWPVGAADGPARDRLLSIFDITSKGRYRGCPFHNAAVEAADGMDAVRRIVHE